MEISRRYLLRNGVAATGASFAYSSVEAAVPAGAFTPEQFGAKGASTRAVLAGLATTSPAYLSEAGREGVFVFNRADRSARVTADTRQGVYVAPTGQNGSTGAWVRRFDGHHNVRWFGAVGDNVTNDGPAFIAAIAYLRLIRNVTAYGAGKGSPSLFVPFGNYYMGTSTLDITHTIRLFGDGHGHTGGAVSLLRWAAGATGIRVQAYNTTGASGTYTPVPDDGTQGSGSTIEGLHLLGGYVEGSVGVPPPIAEGEFHGIHLRAMVLIRNVFIESFQGDGIYGNAAGGGGGAIEGNVNQTRIENMAIYRCRSGIYLNNSDANACNIVAVNSDNNRRFSIWDSSFLGNTYTSCHSADNGIMETSAPFTMVSHNGNRYYVKMRGDGDVAGASTNAPSGTTADNTWWGFAYAGGPLTTIPAWTSGVAYRSGGAYRTDSDAAENVFFGCYTESGQAPFQSVSPTLIVGGLHAAGIVGTGVYARARSGAFYTDSNINTAKGVITGGNQSDFGPQTGAASDNLFKFNNTNSFNNVEFWSHLGGVSKQDAYIQSFRDGGLIINGVAEVAVRIAGANVGGFISGGLNLKAGNVLSVDNQQVVGARGAALPADATDLASAIALLNAIKARLKTTGGHGLVAD